MGTFSIWHWMIVLLIIWFIAYPVAKILARAGYSRIWAILYFVPVIGFVMVWVFAYADWPALSDKKESINPDTRKT